MKKSTKQGGLGEKMRAGRAAFTMNDNAVFTPPEWGCYSSGTKSSINFCGSNFPASAWVKAFSRMSCSPGIVAVDSKCYLCLHLNWFGFMYTKNWLIIKDDSKRTFEVCVQVMSENSFSNKVYGMQKMGMNVSCIIQPITNKTASKGQIKIAGYQPEAGLYDRLLAEYRDITLRSAEEF